MYQASAETWFILEPVMGNQYKKVLYEKEKTGEKLGNGPIFGDP